MIVRSNGATHAEADFLPVLFLALPTTIVSAQQYDLVLEGGRVMDPETGLDATRNVGIRDGKIARISSEALSGRRVVHARWVGGRSRIH
jgi:hypothetical protein